MVRLLQRRHITQFHARTDKLLPQRPLRRDLLNQSPLAHEDWTYTLFMIDTATMAAAGVLASP